VLALAVARQRDVSWTGGSQRLFYLIPGLPATATRNFQT